MEDQIRDKLAHLQDLVRKSPSPKAASQKPAKPDSLSTVIKTKRDADLFIAQLDAVVRLAREEYMDLKGKEV